MKNKKIFGYLLSILGFIVIAINAADYLGGFFGWSLEVNLPSSAIGIVFIILGISIAKKA